MHDSLDGGRAIAILSVESDGIGADVGGRRHRLPYTGLSITRGGANNGMIFFSHPSAPDWCFYTRDWAVLDELTGLAPGEIVQHVRKIRSARVADHTRRWLTLFVIMGIVIGCWSARGAASRWVAGWIPIRWEEKAGALIFKGGRAQLRIIDNSDVRARLQTLAEPVVREVGRGGFHIKLFVMESADLNAFALPGGYIVLTSGLIRRAERAEEVLGVLAHECSHISERHAVRQLVSVIGLYGVADLLLGSFFGTAAALSQAAPVLLKQSFSRDHEREADSRGVRYLLDAGIDPRGMLEFFEQILREERAQSIDGPLATPLAFLNTHPATEDRIAALEAMLRDMPARSFDPQPAERLTALQAALGPETEEPPAQDPAESAGDQP